MSAGVRLDGANRAGSLRVGTATSDGRPEPPSRRQTTWRDVFDDMVVLLCVSRRHTTSPDGETMFPMRVEGATERRARGSARRPMPKRWVSRTFRTCVPGIQASGLRR